MKRLVLLSFLAAAVPFVNAQPPPPQKEVAYRNLSFLLDAALAKDYVAETVPAFRLEVKTDTPDGVGPEHLLIRFRDSYVPRARSGSGNGYAVPEITLYPIADEGDKKFTEDFPEVRKSAEELKVYLARRSHPSGEPVPFLPWADMSQAFIGKRKFLRFRNGRGVLFVTQYQQESLPVNNGALVYTFQGLTDDNAWYVSVVFPVAAPGLPATDAEASKKDFARGYSAYVAGVAERLEKLPAKNYTPNLALLENLVRSIKVQGRGADAPPPPR
jgi:hypothetical protein